MSAPNDVAGRVHTHLDGPTLTLTLDHGPRNLLDPGLMTDLRLKLLEADADASVLGILLTGEGDWFSGGLDAGAIRAGADPAEFARALIDLLQVLPRLGTPVAAAVNGGAWAAGAGIVAACDYAVAADHATIGTMEVGMGGWPMIAQVPLVQRIGARAAMENVGSGEPFAAERAKEVGLVQQLVPPGAEVQAAQDWLSKASRAPEIYRSGRRFLYEVAAMPYDDALEASAAPFVALFT